MKPKLLDLFCGAGGAARGYQMAGFYVTGVDVRPQPRYAGDVFIQGDALEYLAIHGREYDFIHASPPCQKYSKVRPLAGKSYPELIVPIRQALIASGKPYAIENVEGAPLISPTLLCGMMFGLDLYRHRLFETSFLLPFMWDYGHGLNQDRISGPSGQRRRDICLVVGKGQYKGYRARASAAMGIDWMREEELKEAIPPAYTEWIGRQFLAA